MAYLASWVEIFILILYLLMNYEIRAKSILLGIDINMRTIDVECMCIQKWQCMAAQQEFT